MDNKIKAVSYYCKNKYGTSYTPAGLESLYSLHYDKFDEVEINEYIEDECGEDIGYKRLLELCRNNEITLVLIPSLSRVFSNVGKAMNAIKEILGCSNQVSIFFVYESMHFANDEFSENFLKIFAELAEKESEQKSRAMINYIYPSERQTNYTKEKKP